MEPKIIITGPGRSGTSLLMVLLTRMGIDTGWKPGEENVKNEIRAGMELDNMDFSLSDDFIKTKMEGAPLVVKSPGISLHLKKVAEKQLFPIKHIILPIRDLREAAINRLKAGLHWLVPQDPNWRNWEINKRVLEQQENILVRAVARTVEVATVFDIPLTIIQYPRIAQDPDYTYNKLSEVFDLNRDKFKQVFDKTIIKEWI